MYLRILYFHSMMISEIMSINHHDSMSAPYFGCITKFKIESCMKELAGLSMKNVLMLRMSDLCV